MSFAPIMTKALKYGAVVAASVAVLASAIGFLVSGVPGVMGALVGAGLAAVFLGLTTVSMLVASRVTRGDSTNPIFYAIVLGTVGVKLVLFLVLAIWLRGQTWMDPAVFAFTTIAAVIGSLIADALALSRARVPYVSDVTLPGE
ncbi:hypothetical protein BH09ACT4_BH09ACT4_23050 [soil metagenome]